MSGGEILYRPGTPRHQCSPPPLDAEPHGTIWKCWPCGKRYRRTAIQDERGECWQRCQRLRGWLDCYPHIAFPLFVGILLVVVALIAAVTPT